MDCVENDDLLQPHFKKKKTVTNPKPKHFKAKVGEREGERGREGGGEREGGREGKRGINSCFKIAYCLYYLSLFSSLSLKIDKYVLKHQEQVRGGEVKTELYKGDILFTRTGGASVKFTDIEKLDHVSPKPSRRVTRSMSMKNLSSSSVSSGDTDSIHNAMMGGDEEEQEEQWTDVETRVS